MDKELLKTSWKQRLIVSLIAIVMLGSTIAMYAGIILSSNNQANADAANTAKLSEVQQKLANKQAELNSASAALSDQYFNDFVKYKSEIKSFNAATVNNNGLTTRDLKTGEGRELTDGDTDYAAYYIGFCADESIFDSSFDSSDNPTTLKPPIAGAGLIEGWMKGVVGMKLGGVRELTIPGSLAYAESQEICGQTNAPLKFIVQAIPADEKITTLQAEYQQLYYEYLGLSSGSVNY